MPNLAMRRPSSQFSRDGLNLSWPLGGEREVVAWPEEKMTIDIKRRIAEGQIVITDDAPTTSADTDAREYRLLTGEDAKARMAEPAGPVTRVVYEPATPEDERGDQIEVQEVKMQSDRFIEAQAEKAKQAEENHQAIAKRQAAAEKKANAKAPKAKPAEPTEEEAASADWNAANEAAFMEREKDRQKQELVAKLNAAPDDSKEEVKAEPAKADAKTDTKESPKSKK